MDIGGYLLHVREQYESGHATEHSYRPALHVLFKSIDPSLTVINEPKRGDVGMVDFLFQRNGIDIGWAEAKDIDKDVIRLKGYSIEQRRRYEKAYPNLIYTNGVDFEFIREGQSIHFVSIADFLMGLQPNPDRFGELERQLRLFVEQKPISIHSAQKLAEMMAAKAAIIKDEINIALSSDVNLRSALGGQFRSFQQNLLPHLTPDEFADIYAETITYGMFAGRLHDDTLESFSRQEALEKLPRSNPFLRDLFQYIAGPALPDRLRYIVDDLAQVLRASDPHSLFADFGKFTARNDPFIHFYETFLAAYNPKKRKARGVWYTPEPIVDFIVRAVDEVLRVEFKLPEGLADTSKVTVNWDTGRNHPKTNRPLTEKRSVHKVQILDPATGTGTFLAKVVQTVAERVKQRAPGKWSAYVERDLLPRLHGFELLMASYAMCHMKLDMMLAETGYHPSAAPPRLSVWLTNSLEPADRDVRDLFFQALAEEARGASEVKRQTPIMCVIGNPPYSGISQNMGEWISALIDDYKYVDGKHFQEQKHWLHDDYVKFIRMAEHLIHKNEAGGILGFITNHGYLDNPTFRGMRWHLLKTFEKIWVLDLHGNANKQEVPPQGMTNKNVFDIRQGVALIIAVRTPSKKDGLGEIHYGELWGSRSDKNDALWAGNLASLMPSKLDAAADQYEFVIRNRAIVTEYQTGFSIRELFKANVTGIVTMGDSFIIADSPDQLRNNINYLLNSKCTASELKAKFGLGKNYAEWVIANRASIALNEDRIVPIAYRPFDRRWTYFDNKLLWRWREDVMRHLVNRPNLNLMLTRQTKDEVGALLVDTIAAHKAFSAYDITYNFPLYIYPRDGELDQGVQTNFEAKTFAKICKLADLEPSDLAKNEINFETVTGDARPNEVKIVDYIYGVLHAPSYRDKFRELLKTDFPRIPFPSSPAAFRSLSEAGESLRLLHLLRAGNVGQTDYQYCGEGADTVDVAYPKFHTRRIYINKDQYFVNVPEVAWELHIGGYQPAQKWLKDRRGRSLTWEDIGHYQQLIKILVETDRVAAEINLP